MRIFSKLLFLLVGLFECFASDPIRPAIYYDDPPSDVTLSILWDGSFVYRSRTFGLNEVEGFFNGFIETNGKTSEDNIYVTIIVGEGSHFSQIFDLISRLTKLNLKKIWLLEEFPLGDKRWIEIVPESYEHLIPRNILQSKHSSAIDYENFVGLIEGLEDNEPRLSYRNIGEVPTKMDFSEGSNIESSDQFVDSIPIDKVAKEQIKNLVFQSENFVPWIGPDTHCFVPRNESGSHSENDPDISIVWNIDGSRFKFEVSLYYKEAHFSQNNESFTLSLTDVGRNRVDILWRHLRGN